MGQMRRLGVIAVAALVAGVGSGPGTPGAAAEREPLTLITTVTRVVNLPMIVGLRLLEREDHITVAVKDLRSPEAAMLAVIEGQGQVGTGFAPFYPAVEKGAPVRGVMELSRPEFVVMARKELGSIQALHGVRLASHSPKSTVQSLLEFYLQGQPGIRPNVVFIPEGSPARAEALLRGAVDAAAFDLSAAQVVQERAPGKYHVLVDFTDQPVSSSSLVVHADFAKRQPEVVRKLVRRILESYRQGVRDPRFWVRERGQALKEIDDAKLEAQLRALVKIFDVNGGLDRMRGPGALENLSFQVATGNLSGPVAKWKLEAFFDTAPLEAVLRELGKP
jgi:ABC-type nitrate/sulfonate/bicarbonate transport system substrate-binding protein